MCFFLITFELSPNIYKKQNETKQKTTPLLKVYYLSWPPISLGLTWLFSLLFMNVQPYWPSACSLLYLIFILTSLTLFNSQHLLFMTMFEFVSFKDTSSHSIVPMWSPISLSLWSIFMIIATLGWCLFFFYFSIYCLYHHSYHSSPEKSNFQSFVPCILFTIYIISQEFKIVIWASVQKW